MEPAAEDGGRTQKQKRLRRERERERDKDKAAAADAIRGGSADARRGRTWAATVCERVGKSFVMQAVLKPASVRPKAARRPAPPAPTTTASNSWSMMAAELAA